MDDLKKRLLHCFDGLDERQRQTLLSFAEFLASREDASPAPEAAEQPSAPPRPTPIPRPEQETVVAAIKRLSASFHMLDKSRVLHETSSLMAQHMLQGRDARDVIDELEAVFERHYRRLCGEQGQGGACKS